MKISIERNILLKLLSHVQNVVEKRNTIPILSNILINAKANSITLSATDMDLSITETADSTVIEEGSVTTPAQTLYEIVRKIPDGNEIELISNNGNKLSVRSGKSKFSLLCLPKDDFPKIENVSTNNEFLLSSELLKKIIDKTRFAISNEETRYYLNGVYMHIVEEHGQKESKNIQKSLRAVATDGHRLAKFDCEYNDTIKDIPGVIIPKKTVNELYKLLSDFDGLVKINLSSNKIVFFVGESILISKLIDGNFPDYKRVIPKENKNTLKVDRLSFSLAVDRVSTITTDKLPVIKLKIMNNMVNLTSVNNESGTATEDINVNYSGDEIEIGFNSKYILEMINNLEDETVILDFKDSASPVIAKEESNPNLIYVLMPMRV